MMQWVFASGNLKKRREIETMLVPLSIDLLPLADTQSLEVVEDADTFAGNARKKAEAYAQAHGLPALADDSGLCVASLNDAPGVYSARFAGDEDNNAKLMRMLEGVRQRQAYFVCALHVAFPDGQEGLHYEGRVDGTIVTEMTGDQGFGYDPLFFSPELGKTFAQASAEEKASVSHRGRALRGLLDDSRLHGMAR